MQDNPFDAALATGIKFGHYVLIKFLWSVGEVQVTRYRSNADLNFSIYRAEDNDKGRC